VTAGEVPPPDPSASQLADLFIRRARDAARAGRPGEIQQKEHQDAKSQSLAGRAADLDDLRMQDHKTDLLLKKVIGFGAATALAIQLAVVNLVLVIMYCFGDLTEKLAIAWVSGMTVEVVGVVLVVAKYLFPETGTNWNAEPTDSD